MHGEADVKMEAEAGWTCLQAKEHQGWLAAAESREGGVQEMLLQSFQKEPSLPTLISDFWPPEL